MGWVKRKSKNFYLCWWLIFHLCTKEKLSDVTLNIVDKKLSLFDLGPRHQTPQMAPCLCQPWLLDSLIWLQQLILPINFLQSLSLPAYTENVHTFITFLKGRLPQAANCSAVYLLISACWDDHYNKIKTKAATEIIWVSLSQMTLICQYDINVRGDREWGGFCEIPHRGGPPPQEEKSCGKTWHFGQIWTGRVSQTKVLLNITDLLMFWEANVLGS